MTQINTTPGGGLRVRGLAARAVVFVELDADGQIISHTATPREPDAPTPVPDPLRLLTDAQRATVAERRAVCAGCDQNGGLTALTVKCNGCGCVGLSLLNGTHKFARWP